MLVCQRVYPKPGEDLGLGYLKMYMQEYIYVYIYIGIYPNPGEDLGLGYIYICNIFIYICM